MANVSHEDSTEHNHDIVHEWNKWKQGTNSSKIQAEPAMFWQALLVLPDDHCDAVCNVTVKDPIATLYTL